MHKEVSEHYMIEKTDHDELKSFTSQWFIYLSVTGWQNIQSPKALHQYTPLRRVNQAFGSWSVRQHWVASVTVWSSNANHSLCTKKYQSTVWSRRLIMMNYYSLHPHSDIEVVIFALTMNNPANLVVHTGPS